MSDKKAVDMNWLHNGEEDPFKDYLDRAREDLACSDLTDDQLGNYAFMHYDRDSTTESLLLIAQHQGRAKEGFVPKIAFMTAVKERLRWLSRRVAVLEGRYPGVIPPSPKLKQLEDLCKEKAVILEIWYEHSEGGWASNWSEGTWVLDKLIDHLIAGISKTEDEHIIKADSPGKKLSPPSFRGFEIAGSVEFVAQLPHPGDSKLAWVVGDSLMYWSEGICKYVAALGVSKQEHASAVQQLAEQRVLEERAKEIYESWSGQDGWTPWVVGGNSDMQNLARNQAVRENVQRMMYEFVGEQAGKFRGLAPVPSEPGKSDQDLGGTTLLTPFLLPQSPEETQLIKELDSFLVELRVNQSSTETSVAEASEILIANSALTWERFCEGFSLKADGSYQPISYELKLENFFKFREEWRAGKFVKKDNSNE